MITTKPDMDNRTSALATRSNESKTRAKARNILRPTVQAAVTLSEFTKPFGTFELGDLIDELDAQVGRASEGDLGRAEAMLAAQAHTLDAIFNALARRAAMNMGQHMNAAEVYMRLALKTQSQARATVETLAAIKNPQPVAFVRQANIAHGPQQVNNGVVGDFASSTRAGAHARGNFKTVQNELLESTDGERLDTGTASASGRIDPTLAPMGMVDRAGDSRR